MERKGIICIMFVLLILLKIAFVFCFFIVHAGLGLADHVLQDRCAAIAKTVDALGNQFRPAMSAGWLSYIKTSYPDGVAAIVQSVGEGTLVVPDNEW